MRVPTLKEEAEAVAAKNGYYVPPYRFQQMMKAASKITDLLLSKQIQTSYAECKMIMEIVMAAIDKVFDYQQE